MSTFGDNSDMLELFSIWSDSSTIEPWKSSDAKFISVISLFTDDLVLTLSDSFVTSTNNLELPSGVK